MTVLYSSLVAIAASKLVASLAFLFVAARLASRRMDGPARSANTGFAVFWSCLSLWAASAAALDVLAAFGVTPLGVWVFARYASFLLFSVGFAGFVHAMGYVYAGERWRPWPTFVAYALLAAFLVAYAAASGPAGVSVTAWRAELTYETTPRGPLYALAVGLVLLPPLFASLAYAWLYGRLESPAQKRRALLLGASLVTWFASMLATTIAQSPIGHLVTRVFAGSLIAVLVVLAHARSDAPLARASTTDLHHRISDLV